MKPAIAVAALLAILAAGPLAHAQAPAAALPVPSAGVIPDVAGAADKPDPSRVYKLAFDVRSMSGSADAASPAMVAMGRLINTYRQAGVPADHIQAVAVFHGPTIVLVTNDETYRHRTGGKANPNTAMLRELSAAGVKFVVCGVSAREQNYVASDLMPLASLNLSATTTFIDLQLKGYVKVER